MNPIRAACTPPQTKSRARYRMLIKDSEGNVVGQPEFDIQGDADARRTIDVALQTFRGRLRLGDDPLAATLLFGGRGGAERVSRSLIRKVCSTSTHHSSRFADEAGAFIFRGIDPGLIILSARDVATRERSKNQSVSLASGQELANIQLALDENRDLSGIIHAAGGPVIGARVAVYAGDEISAMQARAITDTNGMFTVSIPTDLLYWAKVHGGGSITEERWTVPDLAQGSYQICVERLSGGEVCREGVLANASVLSLAVK
jgi:hypothetical protein